MLPSAFRISQAEVTSKLDNKTVGYVTTTPTKTTNTDSLNFINTIHIDPGVNGGQLSTPSLVLDGDNLYFRKKFPTSTTDPTLRTRAVAVLKTAQDDLPTDGNGYGCYLSAGGFTCVGGGESPLTVQNNLEEFDILNESEKLFLTSDNEIRFLSGCQTWANKKSMVFNTSGILEAPQFKGPLTGNATSASKLATVRTINGVNFDGSANITHFGTCSTAAATAAKTVSLTGFVLAVGAKIVVQFTVTNTAANPTLNVNGTGAKAIVYRNAAISAGYLAANRVYEFIYDGTNYEFIGDINTDTNTDTKVTQTVTTTNAEYAILATAAANPSTTGTGGARFASNIKINPSDNSLIAAKLSTNLSTGSYVAGAQGKSILDSEVASGTYVSFLRYPSTNGVFTFSGYNANLEVCYLTKANVDAGTNTVTKKISLLNETGNTTFPGVVTATLFSGKATNSTQWNGANKTVSTAAPSGGANGDIWFQY